MANFVPVLRFAVMSDIHYKDEPTCERERFADAMRQSYAYADSHGKYNALDALVVVGDFATSGTELQMNAFKASLDENVREETHKVISVASHEYNTGSGGVEGATEKLRRIFGSEPDCHLVINGFHFISVSPTQGCDFKAEKREYIARELKAAAADDPRKPIFFFQHPHIQDTVYGSMLWGNDDFIDILMNYPQIIDFSGHSHAPINDPRSIHQRHFTCLGTGTLSYFELDEFDKTYGTVPPDSRQAAQMLIVEADADGRVRVYPRDVLTDKFFPFVWKIDEPSNPDSFLYTDERYKTRIAPFFRESTRLDISDITESGCTVTFGQAEIEREYVNSYDIIVKNAHTGLIVRKISIWSGYYLSDMPEALTQTLDGLAPSTKYRVEIYANSFWKTRSNNYISSDFFTTDVK